MQLHPISCFACKGHHCRDYSNSHKAGGSNLLIIRLMFCYQFRSWTDILSFCYYTGTIKRNGHSYYTRVELISNIIHNILLIIHNVHITLTVELLYKMAIMGWSVLEYIRIQQRLIVFL